MSATSWVLGGLVVRSPVNVLTNVVLAAECLWLAARLGAARADGAGHGPDYGPDYGLDYGPDHGPDYGPDHGPDRGPEHGPDRGPEHGPGSGPGSGCVHGRRASVARWRRHWGRFLAWTALGAAAGALKHALSGGAEGSLLWIARLASNGATGTAALCAVLATTELRCTDGRTSRALRHGVRAFFALFLFGTALDPRFHLVLGTTAALLAPVLVVELLAWRAGSESGGWLSLGLGLSALTGAVYLLGVSAGPWLDHVDIAHLLVMVGVASVYRGCSSRPFPAVARPEEAPCPSR